MIHILVAEDDPHIRMGLKDTLESEQYAVLAAADGQEALALYKSRKPDLALLDVMMPGLSGYDLCKAIRKTDSDLPVIFLTARGQEIDKVVGLKLGADDYVTKPFGIQELLARIEAVLRRSGRNRGPGPGRTSPFYFGPFQVNPLTFKLSRDEIQTDLTEREVKLLGFFCDHPGEVLSRDALLNEVWGIEYLGTTRTLDQHIAQLRKKVENDPGSPVYIRTVHGVGYRYTPA